MRSERVPRLLCRQGTDSLRQLRYAIMDLALYSSYVPRANATVEESPLYKEVISNTTVLPRLEEDKCADTVGPRVWSSCAEGQPRCMCPQTRVPPVLLLQLANTQGCVSTCHLLTHVCSAPCCTGVQLHGNLAPVRLRRARWLCSFAHIFSDGYAAGCASLLPCQNVHSPLPTARHWAGVARSQAGAQPVCEAARMSCRPYRSGTRSRGSLQHMECMHAVHAVQSAKARRGGAYPSSRCKRAGVPQSFCWIRGARTGLPPSSCQTAVTSCSGGRRYYSYKWAEARPPSCEAASAPLPQPCASARETLPVHWAVPLASWACSDACRKSRRCRNGARPRCAMIPYRLSWPAS